MILEALGDYLVTNNKGTLGTNIFIGKQQPTPDVCITLFEYEGFAPKEHFGTSGFDVDMPRVQVVTRASRDDYPTARNSLQDIRELFSALTDITISETKILRVASLGSIIPLGLDDKDRPRFAANFQAYVER